MSKEDKINDLLKKFSQEIKGQVIPPKDECPHEDLLWKYVQKKSTKKEKEHIEEHLISCIECLETLEFMRKIKQVENEPVEVPEKFYRNANEILQKELNSSSRDAPIPPKKITLLWDKIQNKITQFTSNLEEMVTIKRLEFQGVRKSGDLVKDLRTFPYKTSIKGDKGETLLEIDCVRKEKYLSLKIVFTFPQKALLNIRATLYKSNKIYSSVYLNNKGEVFFPRINEGKYILEFFEENEPLEKVELSIHAMDNEQ